MATFKSDYTGQQIETILKHAANITTLTIKDTYPTLAALQAAFPTGNEYTYQVVADRNVYIWSTKNNAWESLGKIQGQDGKSAYQSAVDGGYTGTETEFNTTLATAQEKLNKLDNGVTQTPTVNLGMNNVIRKTDNELSFLKYVMQGKSYVNLLGKDGNCESISPFGIWQTTLSLDTTNKVFGSNGIKVTTTGTNGSCIYTTDTKGTCSVGKYYFISAYLKNGNATNVRLNMYTGTGGGNVVSSIITDTTKFIRVGIKTNPYATGHYIDTCFVTGTTGQYGYCDGIMVNEITSDEYNNLTVDQLMAKYPYVDSYACLENPYIEVRHDNLVRNGNGEEGIGWWIAQSGVTLLFENNKFKQTSASAGLQIRQIVSVKPNTDYYFSALLETGSVAMSMAIYDETVTTNIRTGVGTFNSGNRSAICIVGWSGTGYVYFSKVHIIEGTTAPTEYKPCRIERCVIEGKFTSDDTVTYENGEVSGLLNWKHKTLYGKDYDWQYYSDATGYKVITAPISNFGLFNSQIGIKYDGKVCTNVAYSTAMTASDQCMFGGVLDSASGGRTLFSVADTDTGWAETIQPNNDEVKAFMNGWKALSQNGTRYVLFKSILDNSFPPNAIMATASANSTGTTITVSNNGTAFKTGDSIIACDATTKVPVSFGAVTGTPTATTITITSNMAITSGQIIVKADNGTTDLSMLTYCKNNIAPNYEGYQLHYKLANPEPITDINTHIHGDIPKFSEGDNYLYLDYGYVLGEIPVMNVGATYTWVNGEPYLRNKVEDIFSVYKNRINDNWETGVHAIASVPYGGMKWARTLTANYDANATYTVDYQILKTMHTTPTSIAVTYQTDILNAISDLSEVVENKQTKDSSLDNLVDLSVYETTSMSGSFGWNHFNGALSIYVPLSLVPKKCTPIVTISSFFVNLGGGTSAQSDITSKFSIGSIAVFNRNRGYVRLVTNDSTTISNLKTNGYYVEVVANFDCRGRI